MLVKNKRRFRKTVRPCPVCPSRHPQWLYLYKPWKGGKFGMGQWMNAQKPCRIFFRCPMCASINSISTTSTSNGYIKNCYNCYDCGDSVTDCYFESLAELRR